MSKFCFVIIESLNRAPYLKKYLLNRNFNYDIIIWDRSANSENPGAENFYVMNYKAGEKLSKIDKFVGYVKFSRFASEILKSNNYKGVFVFTPNVGLLCRNILLHKYSKKYILDIRDYWQEKHRIIYELEKALVKNSFANVISSDAYKNFLPPAEYVITHNSQIIEKEKADYFRKQRNSNTDPIRIACVGAIKKAEYDKKVLSYFANDSRFLLKYIGKGYDSLADYCVKNQIENVYLEGMFPMSETFEKYENVDMIMNMYGNHTPKLDYALSNKLYFAAQLGKPIVVCKDTHMETVSVENEFGVAVDIDDPKSKDYLYDYYRNLDYDYFLSSCDAFMNRVLKDEENFNELIERFIDI